MHLEKQTISKGIVCIDIEPKNITWKSIPLSSGIAG